MTTLSITKPTHKPAGHRSAPGAERIREAYKQAADAIEKAKDKALYCGFLLMEQRAALSTGFNKNQHTPNGDKFYFWLEKTIPEIPLRTAQRWMQAAERSVAAIGSGPVIEVESEIVPMSQILFAPEAELPKEALKYRQLFFDWAADKTIKDCLNAVAVEGEDSKRITLAHNGKNAKGAGGGGDRKDFAKFIKTKLGHIATFLFVQPKGKPWHYRELDELVKSKIRGHFIDAVKTWPRWILTPLAEAIKQEVKLSDEERALRNKEEGKSTKAH